MLIICHLKGTLNLRFALNYAITIFSCEKSMIYQTIRKQMVQKITGSNPSICIFKPIVSVVASMMLLFFQTTAHYAL